MHEALVGGFAAMRALSTRNDDPAGRLAAVRQGSRRFRRREGASRPRPRGARARAAPRRDDPGRAARATAPRPTRTTSRCRRRAASARCGRRGARCRRPGLAAVGHRPRQRPRDVARRRATAPSCRRSGRSSATMPAASRSRPTRACIGHTLGAAGAIEAAVTILHAARRLRPADDQPRRPRRGGRRPRPHAEHGAARATRGSRSSTRSASAARTPRSIFRRWDDDRRASRPAPRPATAAAPDGDGRSETAPRAHRPARPAVLEHQRPGRARDRGRRDGPRAAQAHRAVGGGRGRSAPRPQLARPKRATCRRRRRRASRAGRTRRAPSVKAPLTGLFYRRRARFGALRRSRWRGRRRPGHRPDRGHEAVQRDQVGPRRTRRADRGRDTARSSRRSSH